MIRKLRSPPKAKATIPSGLNLFISVGSFDLIRLKYLKQLKIWDVLTLSPMKLKFPKRWNSYTVFKWLTRFHELNRLSQQERALDYHSWFKRFRSCRNFKIVIDFERRKKDKSRLLPIRKYINPQQITILINDRLRPDQAFKRHLTIGVTSILALIQRMNKIDRIIIERPLRRSSPIRKRSYSFIPDSAKYSTIQSILKKILAKTIKWNYLHSSSLQAIDI